VSRGDVLERAEFDPKLRLYLVLQGAGILVATIVGIVLLPFWAVVGPFWARRYYERLECALTERTLTYHKGILFRSEVTVPLDKIQDLTVKYGPVLDWLGLAKLSVVTAGQHAAQGAEIGLVGVVDAPAFRDRVLDRRDALADRGPGRGPARGPADPGGGGAGPGDEPRPGADALAGSLEQIETLLEDIRDLLDRETRSTG
jgi:putative membrane protein